MTNNPELEPFIHYLVSRNYSEHTRKAYLKDLDQYFEFCKKLRQPLHETQTLYRFFSYLSGSLKQSESSLERKKAALKCFSEFLKLSGKSAPMNLKKFKAPRKKKPLPNHYSDAEIKQILKSLNTENPLEHRNYFFILLAFGTGLRISEILGIHPFEISEAGKLTVKGKGNKERIAYLPRPVLMEYRRYAARFKAILNQNQTLFFNSRKEPLSVSGAQKILKTLGIKTGLSKTLHPHGFRHSFATRMLEEGADVRKVSEMLGHSSLSTTQKYTHLSRKILKEACEKFHPHG